MPSLPARIPVPQVVPACSADTLSCRIGNRGDVPRGYRAPDRTEHIIHSSLRNAPARKVFLSLCGLRASRPQPVHFPLKILPQGFSPTVSIFFRKRVFPSDNSGFLPSACYAPRMPDLLLFPDDRKASRTTVFLLRQFSVARAIRQQHPFSTQVNNHNRSWAPPAFLHTFSSTLPISGLYHSREYPNAARGKVR